MLGTSVGFFVQVVHGILPVRSLDGGVLVVALGQEL